MDFNTFLRYKGFLETSQLWNNTDIYGLNQLYVPTNKLIIEDEIGAKHLRLGKLVEQFMFHQLRQQSTIKWLTDNLQIQSGKQTIGELDAIFYEEAQPIHLEVVYKFYLYDTLNNYEEPLAYWIGPNRKDSLIYKLEKLKYKQLPLLSNPICKPYLDTLNLEYNDIKQFVSFKAQLFKPYHINKLNTNQLNDKCISGCHLPFREMEKLEHFQFYMPSKLDWLIIPHNNVEWLNFKSAKMKIEFEIHLKRSPMLWLKDENNQLSKCFITFW